jgi:hypothetical protein
MRAAVRPQMLVAPQSPIPGSLVGRSAWVVFAVFALGSYVRLVRNEAAADRLAALDAGPGVGPGGGDQDATRTVYPEPGSHTTSPWTQTVDVQVWVPWWQDPVTETENDNLWLEYDNVVGQIGNAVVTCTNAINRLNPDSGTVPKLEWVTDRYDVNTLPVEFLGDAQLAKLRALWSLEPDVDKEVFIALLAKNDDPVVRAMLMKAFANGVDVGIIAKLSGQLNKLTLEEHERLAQISGQAGFARGGLYVQRDGTSTSPYRQLDGTVCGPTSAIYVAALSDPFVAVWIASGLTPPGYSVPFFSGLKLSDSGVGPDQRMLLLEKAVQDRANSYSSGGFPWPDQWGISPWGMQAQLAMTSTNYAFHPVGGAELKFNEPTRHVTVPTPWGDKDVPIAPGRTISVPLPGEKIDPADMVDAVTAAVDAGTPVPLLVGGWADGPAGTTYEYPAHYVVVVGREGDTFYVNEPGTGVPVAIPREDLVSDSGSKPALGNWSQVYGVFLP